LSYTEYHLVMLECSSNMGLNTLAREQRCAMIRCPCDGFSNGATTRIAGVAKNSIHRESRGRGKGD